MCQRRTVFLLATGTIAVTTGNAIAQGSRGKQKLCIASCTCAVNTVGIDISPHMYIIYAVSRLHAIQQILVVSVAIRYSPPGAGFEKLLL